MSVTIVADGLNRLTAQFAAAETALAGTALTATLIADAPYAGFVESGTRFMAAHPFLAPAAEQSADDLAEAAAEGIAELIETGSADALDRRFRGAVARMETLAQHLVRVRTGFLRSRIRAEVGR